MASRRRALVLPGLLVVILAASAAGAEEAPARSMTLEEAVAYAKAHHPEMRRARVRVAAERRAAEIPRSAWLPQLGLTAQAFAMTANNTTGTYVSPGGFMDVPRIGGTRGVATGTFEPYASTFVGAGGGQELFDFGRIGARSDAADARIEVERQRARTSELDVTFDVEEASFAVLAAKSIVKASDEAYDRSRVHRDLAKAAVDAGLRPPIELTRAEADLTRFDIGRIRARGGLATAQAVFAAVVGVDDAALDVAGVHPVPPDLPALEAAISSASARDPRVREALAALRAEELRTRAIGAELRPDLSLTATVSGRAGGAPPSGTGAPAKGDGFVPNVPNWDLGVVLSWPLFDAVVSARRDASRALAEVRRQEVELVKARAVAAIRQAYVAVGIARSALPGLERSIDAARANYAQAEARFKGGLGTSVELADAEALRTDSEIQLALGQFQLARARAAFGRAIAEGL
jgi:outer membrane protein TolC